MMIQVLKQVERGEVGPGFDEQELRNQKLVCARYQDAVG